MDFRVHHILCTQLYRGMGYSGAFCENMTAIVTALRENPEQELRLVCSMDAICRNCPNRQGEDFCANGDNHVSVKDRELLAPLQLEEGGRYTYRELLERSDRYVTMALFEESCRSCEWYDFCRKLLRQMGK